MPPPAGAMTLKQLNDRLEAYINGIGLSPEGPNVSIAVDRISEGGSFNIHDMPQWAEYQQMVRATSNTNIFSCSFEYFFSARRTRTRRRSWPGWRRRLRS